MKSLRSTTSCLRPLATAALALALTLALAPLATPTTRAQVTTGTTITLNAGDSMPTATSIPASGGATIIFNADIISTARMDFGAIAANKTPLIFQSGDAASGAFRTITNTASANGSHIFLFTLDTKDITFDHMILQSGSAGGTAVPNGGGGAILFNTYTGGNLTGAITLHGIFAMNNNYSGVAGGAINVNGASSLEFTDALSFTANHTNNGNGGGIQFGGTTLTFDDTVSFTGNYTGVTNQGGGVNLSNTSLGATFKGAAIFTSNTAGTFGGAINIYNASAPLLFMQSSTFLNNTAGIGGGAITALGTLTFQNGAYFSGNKTTAAFATGTEGGAAIYARGDVTIAGPATFINNNSGAAGGAIFMDTLATSLVGHTLTLDATLGDITFQNNIQNAATTATNNAIAIKVSDTFTTTPVLILNTAASHTIALLDPIATVTLDATGSTYVVQNGDGATLLDTYASNIVASTTINSGNFHLANNATYGASTTAGDFNIAATGTVSGNGAIQAATLALDPAAQLLAAPAETLTLNTATLATPAINFTGGGTLALLAATCAAPLAITANGFIASNNTPLTASLVAVANPANTTPQTLAFDATAPLTIANGGTLAFNLFTGNTNDLLTVANLTLTGSANIITHGDIAGTYELISAGNNISACNFFTQAAGATLRFDATGTQLWLDLVLQNSLTHWTGAAGGIWINSLSTNLNWDNGAGDYSFINGDSVVFDDTATLKTVTIDPAGVIASDMLVNNTANNDYTITGTGAITTDAAGDPTATGKLTKTGAGALLFTNTGSNNFTAGIDISGGAIGITDGNQLGDGGNGIHFTAPAALLANADTTLANTLNIDPDTTATLDTGANTLAYTGTLYLNTTGTLAKTGAGTLRLTTDNSANTGNILVSQGILSLDGPTAALGGALDIATAATLAGSGSATGTVNAATGAIIYPGATTAATAPVTLNIATLNLNSSILSFNLFATGANDAIHAGTLNPGAAPNTINISAFQSGTYNLGNLATLSNSTITIGGITPVNGARQTATLVPNATDLLLEAAADMSRILTWTGAASGTWTPNDADWTDKSTVTLFAGGDRVIFDGTTAPAAAPHTIAIAGNGVNVSDMIVRDSANYTFTGAGITADPATLISGTAITTGTGTLTKAGAGTLAFQNAANTFLGGITLDGGAITYTNVAQLNTGTASINFTGNATLSNLTGVSSTLANNLTVAAGATGTLNDNGANLTLSGILSAAGWSGGSSIVSSEATGSTNPESKIENSSTLAKIGAGTLALTGDSAGADSANLIIALNQGATLLNNTTFAGRIDAAADTTILNANGTTNNTSLRMAASSTLTGAGAFTGSTRLDGAVFADIAASNTLTLSGRVNGPGGFLLANTGELQLDGPNSLRNTGATEIDQGTLRITGVNGSSTGIYASIPTGTLAIFDTFMVLDSYTIAISDSTTIVVPSSTLAFDDYGIPPTADTPVTIAIPESSFDFSGSTIIIPGRTIIASDTLVALASSTLTVEPSVNQAGTIAQNIMLNGGTLAFGLGNNTATNELTANDWSGVKLIQGPNAATSAITGTNDIIHIGSGTFAPALRNGLIVAVNAPNALTVLSNTTNNFAGLVRIDSGTLQVTATTDLGALGAGNTAKVALAGGALQISTPLTTTRAIDLRTDGIIAVDDGNATQWNTITHTSTTSPGYTPLASLTKAGSGTLSVNGNTGIQSTSLTVAEGRVILRGTLQGLNTNTTVAINAAAALEFAYTATSNANNPVGFVGGTDASNLYYYSTSGVNSPAYTGSGTLEVTAGRANFTSPNTTIANINITGATSAAILASNLPVMNFGPASTITVSNQAVIVMGAAGTKMGNLTMNNGGTLAFLMSATLVPTATDAATGIITPSHYIGYGDIYKTLTLATLASTGTGNNLLFNTNLALNQADHITVAATTTGTFNIGITNWGAVPAHYSASLELLKTPDGSDAAFVPTTPTIDFGLFKYTVSSTNNAGRISVTVTGTGAMSNSAALINSAAAALPQSWFAELDTVTQRLGELHFENREAKAGLSAWLRGYGERLNYNAKLTGNTFHETQYAGEAGADCKIAGAPNNVYLGAYAGYGSAQRDYNATGDATSNSTFGGAYLTVSTPAGWYVDAIAKYNAFKTNFTANSPTNERATADYCNRALGGSLEIGKRTDIGNGLFWEPQVQGALTSLTGGSYQTSAGMTVTQLPATILRARAGLRFGFDIETARRGTVSIYLKAYGGSQWVCNGQINILTASGQSNRYSPVITGDYLEAGAGLAWSFAKATQIYIDYSTTDAATYIKPWAFNIGLRHMW